MKNLRIFGFVWAVLFLIADFASKYIVLSWFDKGGEAITVTPFFNIILAFNRGVSFGMFHADSPHGVYMLLGVAVILSALVGTWLWQAENKCQSICFGMILGGALGNIYDRVIYGAVVDFLDFHAFGYHWYTFNIADCGIVIGAILLLIDLVFLTKKEDFN
ncbi:signal peptidase II [Candidatus Odyssella acanthamoebae]|uniref:Lipoprotein signal peptidase n=1 Tax=Candidatus Odyssella acanthamoebae TaxID=91604 RepID=A0A077ATG9_9PROT|nr:signal peptidase II [Candidatus Paracaedibacter acanthamoebae]AIK96467.1 signal peptidase [Candidatus Paracaedibacter acanthamoebae]